MRSALDDAVRAIYLEYTRKFPRQAQLPENLVAKAKEDIQNLPALLGKRVLEVGPGDGSLAREMEERGATVSALDLVDTYLSQLSSELSGSVYEADIQQPFVDASPPPPKSWDMVTLCDVLEHVVRPGDALIAVRELLDDKGLLYVRSPSHETLAKYALQNGCEAEMTHLRTYTLGLLKRELFDAGYKIVSSGFMRTHSEPTLWLAELLTKLKPGSLFFKFWWLVRDNLRHRGVPALPIRLLHKLVTHPGEVWVLARAG